MVRKMAGGSEMGEGVFSSKHGGPWVLSTASSPCFQVHGRLCSWNDKTGFHLREITGFPIKTMI